MSAPPGNVVIIAGPNGAGKTTLAREYLPKDLPFVNADLIAAELAAAGAPASDARAGRLMLEELDAHARAGRSFALETTLSGRSYVPRIQRWRALGYAVQLIFLELPSPEMAVRRVRLRVRQGGHDIPEAVVRRRFRAGLRNFRELYRWTVEYWEHVDNGGIPAALVECDGDLPRNREEHEAVLSKLLAPGMLSPPDAFARAARRAHLVAHRTGTKLVTVRDGEVVEIDPEPEMCAGLDEEIRFGL